MSEGRRYAILIGSSEFSNEPLLGALRCPSADVEGLATVLTSPDFGLFTEPQVFINEPRDGVMRAINRLFKDARRQDQILIYYSGHGKLDQEGHLHLALTDTEVDALEATSMPVNFLSKLINNYACKRVALILDCCYGGAVGKDLLKSGVNDQLQLMRGIYILTASTATQTAREKDGDKYSLLTKHILNGISQGEADYDGDGFVSMEDLFNYVTAQVPREAPQSPTKYELGVQGHQLFIARSFKVFSPERLRSFKEKLKSVEEYLMDDIFLQAYNVIKDNQPKRDASFFALLDGLSMGRLSVGEFSRQWLDPALHRESNPKTTPPQPQPEIQSPEPPAPQRLESRIQPQPAPINAGADSLPLLQWASYETVTLDAMGYEISRRTLQSEYFIEDLDSVILEMVRIPGGEFMRGAPEDEAGRFADERPQHLVAVSGFFLGRYEITQAQWRIVAGWKQVERDLMPDPSRFKGDNRPVENVRWEDAVELCVRRAKKTGHLYRLPTEAEWEYACRAGSDTPFAFGETITPEIVNYNGEHPYNQAKKGESRGETVPVGSLGVANAFGLYDMHGNVWEWCQDWYSSQYYEECRRQGQVRDPQGPELGQYHVLRGGSWLYYSQHCRSAFRDFYVARLIHSLVGFRVLVSFS